MVDVVVDVVVDDDDDDDDSVTIAAVASSMRGTVETAANMDNNSCRRRTRSGSVESDDSLNEDGASANRGRFLEDDDNRAKRPAWLLVLLPPKLPTEPPPGHCPTEVRERHWNA